MRNPDLPRLLRAMAGSSEAVKHGHDVILNAAATELENRAIAIAKARLVLTKASLAPAERVFDATSILARASQ